MEVVFEFHTKFNNNVISPIKMNWSYPFLPRKGDLFYDDFFGDDVADELLEYVWFVDRVSWNNKYGKVFIEITMLGE